MGWKLRIWTCEVPSNFRVHPYEPGRCRCDEAGRRTVSKRCRDTSWAVPELPARDYVSADAWTHDRRVEALRFTSTTGRPALRLILDADLEFGEAERLMALALDRLYGVEED